MIDSRPITHLFEAAAELVAECRVDERVEAAVDEATQVNGEHREKKLRLAQETVGLQLSDGRNGVERRPAYPERRRD